MVLPPPLSSARLSLIVAFPHHWQAKKGVRIFQVETWFIFHY